MAARGSEERSSAETERLGMRARPAVRPASGRTCFLPSVLVLKCDLSNTSILIQITYSIVYYVAAFRKKKIHPGKEYNAKQPKLPCQILFFQEIVFSEFGSMTILLIIAHVAAI